MSWPTARPKPGSRGRRILEDDYDDDEEDAPISDPPEDEDEDEGEGEGEYDDDEDADGDVAMDSPEDDDDDSDEDDDEDAEGDEDDDEDGDEEDEDADGEGEDDDLDADADGEDADAEGDEDDEDEDDEDEDEEEEDAEGEMDSIAATPATAKADTPLAARSEASLLTPSRLATVQGPSKQPTSDADLTPSRPRARQIIDEDDNYDEAEADDADEKGPATPAAAPAPPIKYGKLAPETYTERTTSRRAAIRPAPEAVKTSTYSIEPTAAAPHVAHVHAFSMSADSTVLLTGGSDGYVRSYDLYKTMNGRQMLTQSVRHAYVEGVVRAGVMTHFWGNDEVPRKTNLALLTDELPVSAVHSLACQRDALWGLSGTESGNINLYTIRHASGKIHHVFRKHKAPVSALLLADKDRTMISGSWDRGVHQWDLDTGKIVRSYPGHAGQVSSLRFRPIQSGSRQKRRRSLHSQGEGPSEGLLGDPDTRVSVSIRYPSNSAPNGDRADAMDVDSTEPGTGPRQEPHDEAEKSSKENFGPITNGGTAESPPRPPPAPPDAVATKQEAMSSSDSIALGLSLDGPGESVKANSHRANESMKEEDNDSLFGGSDEDAAGEGVLASTADSKSISNGTGSKPNGSARTDSGANADVDVDADGDADADADDDDGDGDADADDDDQPLFAIAQRERAAGLGTPSMSTVNLPAGSTLARTQSSASLMGTASPAMHASGLLPPSSQGGGGYGSPSSALGLTPALPSSQPLQPSLSSNAPDLAAPQPPPKPRTNTSHLPKPAFGPATAGRGFSDDVSTFSDDILLSTTLAGQVLLWDRRVKTGAGPVGAISNGISQQGNPLGVSGPHANLNGTSLNGSAAGVGLQRTLSGLSGNWIGPAAAAAPSAQAAYESGRGVRALTLPEKTPPWCAAACWSARGDRIYVGRRNETVDEWDLRMVGGSGAGESVKNNPRFVRSLRFPVGSGSVSALCAMPNGRHIVCGSFDNVRLWDTEATGPSIPFRIVAGHHGGFVSQMAVDATAQFLLVASGDRGWFSSSTETLIVHEIQST